MIRKHNCSRSIVICFIQMVTMPTRTASSQFKVAGTGSVVPRHDTELKLKFGFGGRLDTTLRKHAWADASGAKLSAEFKLYYRLRPYIPIAVRQRLQRGRNKKLKVSSDWFLPLKFIDEWQRALTQDIATRGEDSIIHPWPDGAEFASVLTHDVETQEGMRLVRRQADMEEELGFRSAWYFIPHKYRIDWGLISDLRQRGFEIGIHGYNHDGKIVHVPIHVPTTCCSHQSSSGTL